MHVAKNTAPRKEATNTQSGKSAAEQQTTQNVPESPMAVSDLQVSGVHDALEHFAATPGPLYERENTASSSGAQQWNESLPQPGDDDLNNASPQGINRKITEVSKDVKALASSIRIELGKSEDGMTKKMEKKAKAALWNIFMRYTQTHSGQCLRPPVGDHGVAKKDIIFMFKSQYNRFVNDCSSAWVGPDWRQHNSLRKDSLRLQIQNIDHGEHIFPDVRPLTPEAREEIWSRAIKREMEGLAKGCNNVYTIGFSSFLHMILEVAAQMKPSAQRGKALSSLLSALIPRMPHRLANADRFKGDHYNIERLYELSVGTQNKVRAIRMKLQTHMKTYGERSFRDLFKVFDQDGNGSLEPKEFMSSIRRLCMHTEKEARHLLEIVPADEEGNISYKNFVLLAKEDKDRATGIQKASQKDVNTANIATTPASWNVKEVRTAILRIRKGLSSSAVNHSTDASVENSMTLLVSPAARAASSVANSHKEKLIGEKLLEMLEAAARHSGRAKTLPFWSVEVILHKATFGISMKEMRYLVRVLPRVHRDMKGCENSGKDEIDYMILWTELTRKRSGTVRAKRLQYKRVRSRYMGIPLSDEEKILQAEADQAFEAMRAKRLAAYCRVLRQRVNMSRLAKQMDLKRNLRIRLQDFKHTLQSYNIRPIPTEDDLDALFRAIDLEGKSYITVKELLFFFENDDQHLRKEDAGYIESWHQPTIALSSNTMQLTDELKNVRRTFKKTTADDSPYLVNKKSELGFQMLDPRQRRLKGLRLKMYLTCIVSGTLRPETGPYAYETQWYGGRVNYNDFAASVLAASKGHLKAPADLTTLFESFENDLSGKVRWVDVYVALVREFEGCKVHFGRHY
jgi:Ca2+-binding EF-hand superfamily protein